MFAVNGTTIHLLFNPTAASHCLFSPPGSPISSILNGFTNAPLTSHHNQLRGPTTLRTHLDHCSSFPLTSPQTPLCPFVSLPSSGFSLQLKSQPHTMVHEPHTKPTHSSIPFDSPDLSLNTSPVSLPFSQSHQPHAHLQVIIFIFPLPGMHFLLHLCAVSDEM